MQEDNDTSPRHSFRRWWMATVSSTVLALFVPFFLNGESCFSYRNPHANMLIVLSIWLWLTIFIGLFKSGRITFTVISVLCLAAGVWLYQLPLRSDVPAAEANAVRALREANAYLQTYKQSHPADGYPADFPDAQQKGGPAALDTYSHVLKYHAFIYRPDRSTPAGPIDRYTLMAVPCRRECGYQRSFAVVEDGTIFYTNEDRTATRTDTRLE